MTARSFRLFLAVLLMLLATSACGFGRGASSGAIQSSPTAFSVLDHLVPLSKAKSQIAFPLVVPQKLPPNVTLAGVFLQLPGGIPGFPTPSETPTPAPPLHWASLVYRLTTPMSGGAKAPYISLAEADVPMPDVGTTFPVNDETTEQGSPAAIASPMASQETLTIDGTTVAKTVMKSNNGELVNDYYWQHAGLTFDLVFYVRSDADQIATAIITGTLSEPHS